MNNFKKWLGIVLVIIILVTVFIFSNGESKDGERDDLNNTDRSKLVEEFEGAYLKEAIPNGNVVEMDMVAGESEVEIFDGYKTKV